MTKDRIASTYVIVSPVKDEERYVERTIRSMVAQTVRPYRWIIVDDASSDRTAEIVESYARQHDWIQLVRRTHNTPRQPGSGVIRAFEAGYEFLKGDTYDFVVKLDCDLDLPPDYFERLLGKFSERPELGIASGVYLEEDQGTWHPVAMPEYHAAGACKVIRSACFEAIGGFVASRGWDTLDEIRAQVSGWSTQHFTDVTFNHLKPEGSAIGPLKTNIMHGEIYYLTGGSRLFLAFKVLHRMVSGTPLIISGLAMAWGFVRSAAVGKRRLVSDQEARHYARLLNSRIWNRLYRNSSAVPSAQATGGH
jgi:glycosyltransferase involved in cell wall biosynthesis